MAVQGKEMEGFELFIGSVAKVIFCLKKERWRFMANCGWRLAHKNCANITHFCYKFVEKPCDVGLCPRVKTQMVSFYECSSCETLLLNYWK